MNRYYLLIGRTALRQKFPILEERRAGYCLQWMACWPPLAKREREGNSMHLFQELLTHDFLFKGID